MANLFWFSDEQWAVIEPFMPRNQPGPEREDDRRIISGILHVLTCGCRSCRESFNHVRRAALVDSPSARTGGTAWGERRLAG